MKQKWVGFLRASADGVLLKTLGVAISIYTRRLFVSASERFESHFDLILDWYFERKYQISTAGNKTVLNLPEFRDSQPDKRIIEMFSFDSTDYVPAPYRRIFSALDSIPGEKSNMALFDVGSGEGRVLCCGLMRGFKKVIGIEISKTLAGTSERNLRCCSRNQARKKPIIGDWKVNSINIEDYKYEDEIDVIFNSNSLRGDLLEDFLDNFPVKKENTWICYLRRNADRRFQKILNHRPSIRFERHKVVNSWVAIYVIKNWGRHKSE